MGLLILLLIFPELIPVLAEVALVFVAIYLAIRYWYVLVVIIVIIFIVGLFSNN